MRANTIITIINKVKEKVKDIWENIMWKLDDIFCSTDAMIIGVWISTSLSTIAFIVAIVKLMAKLKPR